MADEAKTPEQETESYEVFVTEAVGDLPEGDNQEIEGEGSAKAQPDVNVQPEGQDDADNDPAADAGEEKAKGKSRGRFQKRIDRLTERAKKAEQELQQLKGQGKKPGTDDKASEANTDEPDPSNFDSYDDYLGSLADWKAGKPKGKESDNAKDKGAEEDSQSKDLDEDTEYTEALEDVTDAFEDSRKVYTDFDEVVTAKDVQITKDMVKALAETDDPGELAYYLGKNKDEASRIAGMKPLAQAREIGKLEAKLANGCTISG